jgi:hypothetical protein
MSVRTWALLAAIGLLAAGCAKAGERGAGGGPAEPNEPAQPEQESELTIKAFDFGFDTSGVTSLPPGQVTFTMTNDGEQPQHAQFLHLAEGATFEDFSEAVEAYPAPADLDFSSEIRELYVPPAAGVLNWVSQGEEISPRDELEAGSYVLICAIKDPESGRRHYEMGMLQPFEVG